MYLNLTEGWDPYNTQYTERVRFSRSTFPGGEPHLVIEGVEDRDVIISIRLTSFDEVGVLMMAIDALKRAKANIMSIYIPYMPGARQDRLMRPGEALSVKVYADILNSFDTEIIIADPHSDVVVALLNDVKVIDNHDFVHNCLLDINRERKGYIENLISPDAGSNKKATALNKKLWHYGWQMDLVNCDKTRNAVTGEIKNFKVYTDDLKGKDCFIVDDICSNGGTFLGLADELKKKNAGDLYLIVTHGEFGYDRSETIKRLMTKFSGIYYSDSFPDVYDNYVAVKQIPIHI